MERGQFFLEKGKRNCLNNDINTDNLKKDLANLTETNHHINMTSDHPVSSNNWFKSHFNAKSLNMSLTL